METPLVAPILSRQDQVDITPSSGGVWLPAGPVCPQCASLWPASSAHIRIQPLGGEGSLSGLFWSIPCWTWVPSSSLAGALLTHRYSLWLVCSWASFSPVTHWPGLAFEPISPPASEMQPPPWSLSHLPSPSPAPRDLWGEIQWSPSIFIPSRFQTPLGARWTGLRPFTGNGFSGSGLWQMISPFLLYVSPLRSPAVHR